MVVGLGVLGIDLQGDCELGSRLGVAALVFEGQAELVMDLGDVIAYLDGELVLGDCRVQVAPLRQVPAEVVVRQGVRGPCRQSRGDRVFRYFAKSTFGATPGNGGRQHQGQPRAARPAPPRPGPADLAAGPNGSHRQPDLGQISETVGGPLRPVSERQHAADGKEHCQVPEPANQQVRVLSPPNHGRGRDRGQQYRGQAGPIRRPLSPAPAADTTPPGRPDKSSGRDTRRTTPRHGRSVRPAAAVRWTAGLRPVPKAKRRQPAPRRPEAEAFREPAAKKPRSTIARSTKPRPAIARSAKPRSTIAQGRRDRRWRRNGAIDDRGFVSPIRPKGQ